MIITKNMIFYYPMEGNIDDATGNGNNGTLINSPMIVDGKFGKCYDFNGTNQTIRTITNLGDISGGFTISCWVYADDLTSLASREIYRKEDGVSRILLSFQNKGTLLSFGINVGGYSEFRVSITASDYLNKWKHIVVVYDNSIKTKTIYSDGIVIGAQTRTGGFSYGTGAYGYIGCKMSGSPGEWFDGKIDDFVIFNKPLDISNIRRLMLGMHPII